MEIELITNDNKKAKDFFVEKISFLITPFELNAKIKNEIEKLNIIDVRKYEEYLECHIPYASHVPFEEIKENLIQFSKDKLNIIYTYSDYCHMAYKTAYYIAQKGYNVRVLSGGFLIWKKLNFDCVRNSEIME